MPGLTATVYRTVDEQGVVSFSDIKPAGDPSVETMEIDARAPQLSEVEQQRLQDMRETTDRMAADRMAREKHRAELRKLQAETQPRYQNPAQGDPGYAGYSSGYSGYYNYPARRPWRPIHRPRPEHPIVRPPLRPPLHGDRPPIGIKLPGNDYPASLIRRNYPPKVREAFRN